LALHHALPHITADHVAQMRGCLDSARPGMDVAELEAVNQRFHDLLAQPCGMPRLLATLGDLHKASSRHLFAAWKWLDWRPRSDREHDAILAAVAAGEVDQACALLAEHIMAAGEALAEALRRTKKEKAPARGAQAQA
jgi:DNA-binding GntR family transcriptional regulator